MKKVEILNKLEKTGVIAVGVGGNLLDSVEKGDFEEVTQMASEYMDIFYEINKN